MGLQVDEEVNRDKTGEADGMNLEVDSKDEVRCIRRMKLRKAAGHDGIEVEHLLHAHPILINVLSILFNAIVRYGYVPNGFGNDIIIPLAKDKLGNLQIKQAKKKKHHTNKRK